MKAVVIGGQGFLGGATVRSLLERGDSVTVLDRSASRETCDRVFGRGAVQALPGDILDAASLASAFRGADEVYNFAGALGTSELEADPAGAIAANVTGAVNVFEAALAAGVGAVFHPSKPNVWLNTYTITKFAAEQFALLYAERGLRVHILRFFNAYGPGQATGPVRKIIPTFALQARRGEALSVYGDGEQTVDMIYSADVGRICVDVVRSAVRHGPLDCGRGIAMTVNEVACEVNRHFGNDSGIAHKPMRVGETPGTKLVADTKPLRDVLRDLTFADWRQSLATTLDYYAKVST